MIIKYLLQGAIIIINWFINNIITTFTDAGLGQGPEVAIASALQALLGFLQQANNFCYLLLGEAMYIVLPIALEIIGLKYTVLPIFIILRHHIPIFKGGR